MADGRGARRRAHPVGTRARSPQPSEGRSLTEIGPRFGPPEAIVAPRYAGVRTFARLPHVTLPHVDVDAAVLGAPFDTATSFRPGARFGPEAVRPPQPFCAPTILRSTSTSSARFRLSTVVIST